MTRAQVLTRRIAIALAALAAVGAVAAYATMEASADGRRLEGAFCRTATNSPLCISLTWDGVTYTRASQTELSLRPGTYWITVNDDSVAHNFSLRSCPDGADNCAPGSADSTVDDLTTIPDAPGEVTVKMVLKHGTYRLFCARAGHEAGGMYVDFSVGGVGQVDD